MEDLGTWPAIVGIEEEGGQWMGEGWNIEEGKSKELMNTLEQFKRGGEFKSLD